MQKRAITLTGFLATLTGCFNLEVEHPGIESMRNRATQTSLVQAVTSETGAVTATFSAQSTTTQILSAAANEAVSGTVVAMPPGTLTIDTTLSIEEAASIATETMGAELGLEASMQQTGTAVSVQPEVPIDPKQPFSLAIPLPTLNLVADEEWSNLIVVYKVQRVSDGTIVAGIIPRAEITVENNVAKISVTNFGAFQTALTSVPVTEEKQVATKAEIVTKQEVAQRPAMTISSREPFVAKERDVVTISGKNFRPGMLLALGGKKVGNLIVVSDSKATFVAPKLDGLGLTRLSAEQDGVSQAISMFYSGVGDLPVITKAESEVCSGEKYYDASGAVKVGTKTCLSTADIANLTAANLKSGVTILGIQGSLEAKPAACSAGVEVNCVASTNYPAVDKGTISANQIVSGATIAGISGTYTAPAPSPSPSPSPLADCVSDGEIDCKANTSFRAALVSGAAAKIQSGQTLAGISGSAAVRPSNCAGDGETACVTVANFPAVDKTNLSSNTSKFQAGFSIAGVSGTLGDCSADGGTNCVAVSNYPALNKSGAAAKIISGFTLGGVSGTGSGRPADCAADGALDCVAVSGFPAMNSAAAAAKIVSGQSIAGVSGTAGLRPADCANDGEVSCVTVANYPAIDKSVLTANASKIRSSVTMAGVAGILADCVSDGDAGCVVLGPTYAAALVAGADAKIISGQVVAGVNGSAAARPADCSIDGATGCVAVASYPAAELAGAAAKIVAGQSLAGTAGTASGVRPSDCSSDAELGCVSVAGFPAMDASIAAPKIANGDTLGGVAGTASARPSDCSADGGINCVAVTNFPAVDKVTNLSVAKLAKIHSSVSVAGLSGTMASCSSDGGTDCMAVGGFPAANASSAAAKILTGQTLAGISGTAALRPADCSSDGESDCVSVSNYPAVDKNALLANANKIRSSLSIASISGTLTDCAGDGSNNCVAVSSFPAANIAGAAAKILTGQSLAGIAGSAALRPADCSSDNGTDCVAVANFPSVVKANVTAGVIKNGTVIAGVTGQYPSSTYLLPGASATADLNSATFSAKVKSATAFEWYDAEGLRYTGAGDADLTAANIKSGVDIFGSTGIYGSSDCTGDGQTNCITTSTYKSVDTSALGTWDIRSGKSAGGISGSIEFYKNLASLSFYNRASGTGSSTSTTVADVYDTIDDYNNNGSMPNNAPSGWPTPGTNWLRDPLSDSNSSATCDGAEGCVYQDRITGLYWSKDDGTARIWDSALSTCYNLTYGGYSDWRLPTVKELLQAHISGMWQNKTALNIAIGGLWSATASSVDTTSVFTADMSTGFLAEQPRSGPSGRSICVRP